MRQVSEAFKKAYMTGAQKFLYLDFSDGTNLNNKGKTNEISEGSMQFHQVLCDEEQLHFGLCNAASFSINILAGKKRYRNLFVTPTIESGGYQMKLGKFRITEDQLTDDRMYRTLTCYDQMTDLLTDDVSGWYAALPISAEQSMTMRQFRDNLFSYFYRKYGVKQAALTRESGKLPNDDMKIYRTIDSDNPIDGQQVLERICEINGCFGVINEDGDFEYRFLMDDELLFPANDLYPADDLYPVGGVEVIGSTPDEIENGFLQGELVWQEYEYQPITKLQIHQTENDIGAIVGEDGNAYEVYDNFLVYGYDADDLEAVANNLLNQIKKTVSYTPARVAVRGRPWLQTGDLIYVYCRGQIITFPMLVRDMSGITALKDQYEAQGQEYFSFDVTGTNHEIYGILRKTYEITKNVNGLSAKATEIDSHLNTFESEITQTAREISTRVSNNSGEISRLTQRADSISLEVQNKTSAASIVASINKAGSNIKISADHIELNGFVTFNDLSDPNSKTEIHGGHIKTGTLVANEVVTAWNAYGDKKVYLDSGGLHCYDMVFNGSGTNYYNNGSFVGYLGSTQWERNPSFKGIAFNIRQGFMSWGYATSGTYQTKLLYDSTGGTGNLSDSLNLGCKFDCHGNEVRSANLTDVRADGYSAVTKDFWVTNSNGQPAGIFVKSGIVTGYSGF